MDARRPPRARDTEEDRSNLALITRYYDLMNRGPVEGVFTECLDPAVVQEEFPNQLLPNGARRDLAALREAAVRGRALMAGQHFDVVAMYPVGGTVIVESVWTGTVAVDAGPFRAGTVLRAHFAQFFEVRDGRITAIRNYDCFDPWPESP